ncbi:MAG TPA: flavodoxin domain-containing protein [Anaerolineales bacterium]|nr:flavodoxin domain-containing protein [Anaerolineales bacterium]
MHNKILVTYASRAGSTVEIAREIADTLSQGDIHVELLPMQDVKSVTAYSAVAIGSPIRKSQWLPEAIKFIQDHRAELIRKRVATFTVSITLAMSNGEHYRQAVAGWIAPVRAQLKPVSEGLFAGKLDFTKLPVTFDTLKLRLVVALGIFPKDDRRDWKAIHAWADSLPPLLLH